MMEIEKRTISYSCINICEQAIAFRIQILPRTTNQSPILSLQSENPLSRFMYNGADIKL